MKQILLAVAVFMIGSTAASAHSHLLQSTPVDKAVLAAAPQKITMRFSEPVRLTALKLHKAGESEHDVKSLPKKASADFALQAPKLSAGDYVVSWRAFSNDGHVMEGKWSFQVQHAH